MGRKNNNKTSPALKKIIYKSRLRKIERELCTSLYIVEKLQQGEDLLMQERAYLIDKLLVKVKKLQARREHYVNSIDKL